MNVTFGNGQTTCNKILTSDDMPQNEGGFHVELLESPAGPDQ